MKLKNEYIKSPLNYVGGKFKLLKEIIPLFPDKINTFVDLFGGGFNVGINAPANHVIYNDVCKPVTELLNHMAHNEIELLLEQIDSNISKYKLSKENKEGYMKLREDYNSGEKSPMNFYTLLCYAFNNQIRFNNKGEYNMPFGKDRSSFNPTLRRKFIEFVNALHKQKCTFVSQSFDKFNFDNLYPNDFVYCDPPYLNSVAAYNERGGWTENDEAKLLRVLDKLDESSIRFALSNNLKYNNPTLDKWKDKYNVHYLNADYSNCNYHKTNKSKDIEILIINY